MGQRGPLPKDPNQRVRRNKYPEPAVEVFPTYPITRADAPDYDIEGMDLWGEEFYESLRESGFGHMYEKADWQIIRLGAWATQALIDTGKVNGNSFSAVTDLFSKMAVTKADRVRLGIAAASASEGKAPASLDVGEMIRKRLIGE
jgi:hypothetical protein